MAMNATPARAGATPGKWDTAYEIKAITLLTIGFGLVGLDRMIIAPLFAAGMGKDLGLGPADLGELIGILGVFWGLSAIVLGNLSDRLGRKRVLVPAVVLFSVLSGLSGLATGLVSLLAIRAIMGIAEGATAPIGVAAAVEASHPSRRGLNNGLFQCSFALFGLAIAPIVATQLLQFTSWRSVFLIVGIPGLIVAILLAFTLREPVTLRSDAGVKVPRHSWIDMFQHRNVPLGMLGLLCAMAGIFVISAMTPNYLTDYLKLNAQDMGYVTSAIGFGGFIGQFGVPALSDLFGRKRVTMISFVVAAIFLYLFIHTGVNLPLLFVLCLPRRSPISEHWP
jgi:predicted MFS family arabinose efflux permease